MAGSVNIIPLILIALVAPTTAWFGVQYVRAANEPHKKEGKKMPDILASEITEKMHIREYGSSHNDGFTVEKVGWHGDTVLITGTDGEKKTFGPNEVVEVVKSQPVVTTARLRSMTKAPKRFPARDLRSALEELIARREAS